MSQDYRLFRIAGILLYVTLIVSGIIFIDSEDLLDKEAIEEDAQESLLLASLAFVGTAILLKLLFVPVTPLSVIGGYVFGPYLGFLLSLISLTVGSVIPFFIARKTGKAFTERLLAERLPGIQRYNRMVKENGFLTVVFFRVVPTLPISAVNFIFGLSKVRFRDFLLGSVAGFAPTLLVLSFIGDMILDFTSPWLYGLILVYLMMIAAPILWRKYR